MAKIKVKNKVNTTGKTPEKHTSWLAFWEDLAKRKATTCENMACNNSHDLVGAHVIKSGEGAKEYILPLCKSCNNAENKDEFDAWDSDLISVK